MSTTSKKKTPIKAPEAKAKYNIGQTVFLINYHKGKPEELFEVKIDGRMACESRTRVVNGSPDTSKTFSYSFSPSLERGSWAGESELYPNFTEAAKVFAKAFLLLLK